MNWYLAAYVSVCCALLGFIALRYSRVTTQIRPRWSHILLWAVASAFSAVVIWSSLGCLLLPMIEGDSHFRVGFLPTCIAISGYFAGFLALVFLPPYVLLLGAYASVRGTEPRGTVGLVTAAMMLATPVAVALAVGFAFPISFGVDYAVRVAAAPVVLGYFSTFLGLLAPRLALRALGPGRLLSATAA